MNIWDLLNQPLPSDQDAEVKVLSNLMLNDAQLPQVRDLLSSEDFIFPENQILYDAILRMWSQEPGWGAEELAALLREEGTWSKVGIEHLKKVIYEAVPPGSHALYYAEIVRDKAIRRGLGMAFEDTLHDITDTTLDTSTLLQRSMRRVFDLQDKCTRTSSKSISDLAEFYLQGIDSDVKDKAVIPTGFQDVDRIISGGLFPSTLTLIAARPSVGKTSIALNIAISAGVQMNYNTVLISLEMSEEEICSRAMSDLASVSLEMLRIKTLFPSARERMQDTAQRLQDARLTVVSSPSLTVTDIAMHAQSSRRFGPVDLIVIDYLQLIKPVSITKGENREQQVSKISRSLKELAMSLKCPVVCCCQLNRQSEMAKDVPRLSHLRESGSLEQDADIVMFLHREKRSDPDVDVIIAKHRNGPTGKTRLLWRKEFCRFMNSEEPIEVPETF